MKRIAYYVIAVHVFLVLWSALWMPSKKVDRKPLQVRTVVKAPSVVSTPQPIVQQAVQKTAPKAAPAPVKPQTAAKPSPKPQTAAPAPPKPQTASKPAPKSVPQPAAKKSAPVRSSPVVPENLVHQLQESIAKIDQKSHKESPKEILPAPKWIPQLTIDEDSGGEESLFVAALVQYLQEALDLPEVGEVKVELVLKCNGSFVRMKVVSSQSEKNKKFLEHELKAMTFPPFEGNLKNEKEHAFIITFCNS